MSARKKASRRAKKAKPAESSEVVVIKDPAEKYYEQSRKDHQEYDEALRAMDGPLSPEAEDYLRKFVMSL